MRAAERNAIHVSGAGTPMVLVHGFGCDQTMWRDFEAALGVGFRVVRYDLTGMGASDYGYYDPGRHGSLEGHAHDLVGILDAMHLGPAIVVGHSVSAIIAGLAARDRPDLFKGLVMLCPSASYINDPPYVGGFEAEDIEGLLAAIDTNYQGWAGQLAGMVAGPDGPADELEDRFCRNDPWITKHFATVTFRSDYRQEVASIDTPTLIVALEEDMIAPRSAIAFMEDRLPDARTVTLPGRGHSPHMTAPRETADAVRAFAGSL